MRNFAAAAFAITAMALSLPAMASSDLYVAPGPIDAVNLLSRPYAYEEKDSFVAAVKDRMRFFDEAMKNWKETPAGAREEAKAYAGRAQQEIGPLVDRARKALDSASSASSGGWQSAQSDSRRALLELQRAYYQLHGNTIVKGF